MKCPSAGSGGPHNSGSKWSTEDVSKNLTSSSGNVDNCYYVSIPAFIIRSTHSLFFFFSFPLFFINLFSPPDNRSLTVVLR